MLVCISGLHRGIRCRLLAVLAGLGATGADVRADWRTDSSWHALQDFLGGVGVPDGAGVVATQVEALESETKYMPASEGAGSGSQYSGKTFVAESGSSAVSNHANVVGTRYFGNVSSVAPGVTQVHCWSADDWLENELSDGTAIAGDIMSGAFILTGEANEAHRALDYQAEISNLLPVMGTNNGSSTTLPDGMVGAYNIVSVGLTNGNHAAGFTPAGADGPGRIKPEIVVGESLTSWATGAVSSIAALIHGALPPGGKEPAVVKAVMLAGATKEEFPSWDKTDTRPLDDVYGAGEADILNSYRIVDGGDQGPGPVGRRGWHLLQAAALSSTAFTFVVPAEALEGTLSLVATWQRGIELKLGVFLPDPLADVNLELRNDQMTLLQQSVSTVDNIEHIYFQGLAPGSYTLTVTTDLAADIALAWRLELASDPDIVTPASPVATLGLERLIPGATYTVERSTDFSNWSEVKDLTATGGTQDWTDPLWPLTPPVAYRLRYFPP